ncbi:uncharacterized protein GGS22DRAFT_174532 [Annulohypoxylon maeteangense]|uniref:uncharacterized protein n=1 Tax=Annulohypoxylon maeteangense TaxID=1927788 RepID=UPI002008C51A|nr:uncharacterized protein GGS22DRAFT_174532 [Annulohypoxylon maeteangense]KAI0880690.1 hypothetical protein GGS22DRAFT_174532 [Annulohypoxylon maeteangense]
MFSIDKSLLPALTTRKALLVIDPQNDFLDEDGAYPINYPMDLPDRIAGLVTGFRQGGGDIIWVSSRFEKSRSIFDEQILTSDRSSNPRSPDHSRGRRRQAPQHTPQASECPEAFLTQETPNLPKCVRTGSCGIEMHRIVKAATGPRDYSVVKSYYSAFRSEQLLRLLRMRLVTELFICGSSTNTGVMATAVDAASHGYTITIVEDCSGYHNIMRHRNAIKQISNTTGCDVLAAEDVLTSLKPKSKQTKRSGDRPATSPAGRFSTVRRTGGGDDSSTSSASELLSSFENLSLSAERTVDTPKPNASTENAALSIQPLVNLVKPKTAESNRKSRADSSSSRSGRTDSASRAELHRTILRDESQSGEHDKNNDVQALEVRKTLLPAKLTAASQSNSIVPHQHSSEILLPDKKHKATVPTQDQLEGDEDYLSSEIIQSSSSGSILSPAGIVSETPSEKSPQQTKTPADDSKVEVNNNSKMAPQEVMAPRESEPLAEGDTKVIYDVLLPPLSEDIFEKIKAEVDWRRMNHQGGEVPRLVAVQGQVDEDGTMPIYRHPSDESPPLFPFTSTVRSIKETVEKHLGHPLNHVLIQLYRNGNDYISEHSDKTLDIVQDSFIANVSLGAERTMVFRSKRELSDPGHPRPPRKSERASLPHNSLCKMGLTTNMRWLHSIRQDKRMDRDKTEPELAYDGARISLTFRQIGTFLDRDGRLIWGQGATAKTRETANNVINGQTPEAVKMLKAFSKENLSTKFDWNEYYGKGFDVLHISAAPRLFLSSDAVVNMRIQLMLAEYGVSYSRGSMSALSDWQDSEPASDPGAIPIKFVDVDSSKTIIEDGVEIMLYLDRIYGQKKNDSSREEQSPQRDVEKESARFQEALTLLGKHRENLDAKTFQSEMRVWETYAAEDNEFIAGPTMSLADYAFWPIVNDIMRLPGQYEFGPDITGFDNLKKYHERIRTRDSGRKTIIACTSCIRKKPTDGCESTTSASTSASASGSSPS